MSDLLSAISIDYNSEGDLTALVTVMTLHENLEK